MIEVEKKFSLSESDIKRLTKSAQFLGERFFVDIYYDTKDFSLIMADKWFRSREGKFELKIPLQKGPERILDQYEEVEDEGKIKEALGIESDVPIAKLLETVGYFPFCVCKTTRKKYKNGKFNIDIDNVSFDGADFTYNIAEVEVMVAGKDEVSKATQDIIDFAKSFDLKVQPVRGKVIEYLKRMIPKQYKALRDAGVVNS